MQAHSDTRAHLIVLAYSTSHMRLMIYRGKFLLNHSPHCRAVEVHHQPFRWIERQRVGLLDSLQPRSILGTNESAASVSTVEM